MPGAGEFILSRFARTSIHNEVVAIFNTLNLQPVFLDRGAFDALWPVISSGIRVGSEPWRSSERLLKQLVNNRILVSSPSDDDRALKKAQDAVRSTCPHILYLILTDDCNLGCTYCLLQTQGGKAVRNGQMSESVANSALDYFCGSIQHRSEGDFDIEKQIVYYGGEPLLNFDVLRRSVDYARSLMSQNVLPRKTRLTVVTNGTLLTRERASYLKSRGVNVGISIDGDELITDSNRSWKSGIGSYAHAIRAVRLCQDMGVAFSLSTTITPEGLQRSDRILAEILEIRPSSVGFNILVGPDTSVPASYGSEAAQFLIKAFEILRSEGIFEDRMMRKVRSFVDGTIYLYDCAAAGGSQVVAYPDGSLGICHGFASDSQYTYGNVLRGVSTRHAERVNQEWLRRSPLFMPECLDCCALSICGGGCPYNAFLNAGTIWGLDKRFCHHATQTLDWLLWDLYENSRTDVARLTNISEFGRHA